MVLPYYLLLGQLLLTYHTCSKPLLVAATATAATTSVSTFTLWHAVTPTDEAAPEQATPKRARNPLIWSRQGPERGQNRAAAGRMVEPAATSGTGSTRYYCKKRVLKSNTLFLGHCLTPPPKLRRESRAFQAQEGILPGMNP